MNFPTLNDDCLRELLCNLPLSKQLEIRLISTKYANIIEDIFRRRKCLSLIVGCVLEQRKLQESMTFGSQLQLRRICLDDVLFLTRFFPKIRKLSFLTVRLNLLEIKIALLNHWQSTLTSLSMITFESELAPHIIQLPHLESLHISNRLACSEEIQRKQILRKLKSFKVGDFQCEDLIHFSSNLRELRIEYLYAESLDDFLPMMHPQAAFSLEKLHIDHIYGYKEEGKSLIETLCERFPSLQSLRVWDPNYNYWSSTNLFENLSNLHQLTDLSMPISVLYAPVISSDEPQFIPLNSVTTLRLTGGAFTRPDPSSFASFLRWVFPNLKAIVSKDILWAAEIQLITETAQLIGIEFK